MARKIVVLAGEKFRVDRVFLLTDEVGLQHVEDIDYKSVRRSAARIKTLGTILGATEYHIDSGGVMTAVAEFLVSAHKVHVVEYRGF